MKVDRKKTARGGESSCPAPLPLSGPVEIHGLLSSHRSANLRLCTPRADFQRLPWEDLKTGSGPSPRSGRGPIQHVCANASL